MRTVKPGAGPKALAVIITAFLMVAPVGAPASESATKAIAPHGAPTPHSAPARTEMVLAGMAAALAALMLLRRDSARND